MCVSKLPFVLCCCSFSYSYILVFYFAVIGFVLSRSLTLSELMHVTKNRTDIHEIYNA